MSISAMKYALQALEDPWGSGPEGVANAIAFLRQAIAEAEKQEPVAIGGEWKPCVKLPIVVHVREQRKGETHVSTREGITPVKEDDLIMRGVAGEEYPIGRELFNRTYTFDTAPVHAIDISQEHVDETAKGKHDLWIAAACLKSTVESAIKAGDWKVDGACDPTRDLAYLADCLANPKHEWAEQPDLARVGEVGVWGHKREWVGLTHIEIGNLWADSQEVYSFAKTIEAKLKEKNT